MDAFLFTLALFAFWGLIGFATISISPPRLRLIQGILISPAIGIAVTILPVFFINRAGVPVKDFGGILLPILAALAVLVLVIKRPIFPAKRCLPFFGIVIAALLLAAHPMFRYGFDWLSFSNDDMANYSLAAQRFLNHGFFDQPNLNDLFSGKDYSLVYWFMHVAGGVRSGSELMLAVVWAFSGLNAHQIFMPVIMALHLALIAGAGAMVSGMNTSKKTPMIAMSLMALSPMTTLGALYQLIGQVGGVALLCAAVTLMYRPRPFKPIARQTISNIPAVLVFAAIFVWYPEVLPFFGLGWLLYVLLLLRFNKSQAIKVVLPALMVGVLVFIALDKYALAAFTFILGQVSGGMKPAADLSAVMFPYFLVPSGIAALWGLIPIAIEIREPFVSLAIAGGLILICWLVRRVIPDQARNGIVPISMLLVMATMGLLLFYRNNDFGLFKLAMFVQPFLLGVVAVALAGLSWKGTTPLKKIIMLIFLISMSISQSQYVGRSTGEAFGALTEVPLASEKKVNRQFQQLFNSLRKEKSDGYIADTSSMVLAKYQSLYSRGESLLFPSRIFFDDFISTEMMHQTSPYTQLISNYQELKKRQFVEHQIETSSGPTKFLVRADSAQEISRHALITAVEQQTIFNGTHQDDSHKYFSSMQSPRNHLVFVHSSLGTHYYFFGDRKKIAFYQLENDPMFPNKKLAALGEHLLFFVMGPSNKSRIVMELTDTVVKQFTSELPKPKVQNMSLDFVGRGTGRTFSQPIEPTYIDGVPYISIDMAREGRQFPGHATGLMLLYGRNVHADPRRVTTFGRNISLVSEEEYLSLQPPASLQNFPADLANKNLEYSGIYEDGWISERSFFVLLPQQASRFLVIKGSVPQIKDPNFSSTLKVNIDGKEIAQQKIGLGSFELKIPVTALQGRQRVDITFTDYQQLPGEDGRITGGKLDFIGFTENQL
jgi:hypothetical protein